MRLRDVADQAGVALGTLYSRFSSKEMLVAALDENANFEAVISDLSWSDTDPVQRVADLGVAAVRFAARTERRLARRGRRRGDDSPHLQPPGDDASVDAALSRPR